MNKPGFSDLMQGNVSAAFSRRAEMQAPTIVQAKPHEGRVKLPGACLIEVSRVVGDPDQPRTDWSSPEAVAAIQDLVESIKARGQLQPIRVRWNPGIGKFQVIVGERRLRAATLAGLSSIACVVVEDNATPEDRTEDMLVENALRTNLTAIESAKAYQLLIDRKGYTHRELAERLNIPHPAVTQAMQLLTLPAPIQAQVDAGEIKPATAYEIAKIEDPAEQAEMAEQAAAGRLSRTEARERVARATSKGRAGGGKSSKSKGMKSSPLPTTFKHRAGNGLRILCERSKGFDLLSVAEALEEALASVRARLEERQRATELDARDD